MQDFVHGPPPRERYTKRWMLPLGLLGLFVMTGCGGDDEDTAGTSAQPPPAAVASPAAVEVEPAEVAAAEAPKLMEDWSGKSVQAAVDAVTSAGRTADAHDVSGAGRTVIIYSNWQVCDQSVATGQPVAGPVSFGAVKFGESCSPSAPSTSAALHGAAVNQPAADETAAGTVSQQNAIKTARSYLSHSAFSRSGLIEQLEYEGFSTADAIHGVDSQQADWNAQAADSARSYLSHSSFSRSGLIEQLEYEGFTRAQAEYGVAQTGL